MRNEAGRSDGVTYIGPRSFVIGFAAICGVLLAIGFGAARITDALEQAVPLTATRNAPVPATMFTPDALSVRTSLPTTISVVPPILSTVMPARRSAPVPTTLNAPWAALGSRAAVQVNVPIAAKTPIGVTTKTTIAAITKAPIPAMAITKAPIPAVTKAPIPAKTKTHIPTRAESSPAVLTVLVRVKPVVSRLVLAPQPERTRTPLVQLSGALSHPAPASLLVPFKTSSTLPSSSALEPRSAGGAPLIINPARLSATPP